jgi:uncharacterized protein with PIN domain
MDIVAKVGQLAAREKLLRRQRRELAQLRAEVTRLRLQNDKINRAMRRCLTCEYRLEAAASD